MAVADDARPRRPARAAPARTGAPSRAAGSAHAAPRSSAITSDLSTSEAEQVEDRVAGRYPSPAQTRLGGLEREAAGEHAEAPQQRPARRRTAARGSSRPTRAASAGAAAPCACRRSAAGSGRPARAAICSTDEHPHPRRGQLDRQRDAVELLADLRDRRRVLVGDGEVRTRPCVRARRTAAPRRTARAPRRLAPRLELRQRQRRHAPVGLARRRRAARGSSPGPSAAGTPRSSASAATAAQRLEQVLAVVERPASARALPRCATAACELRSARQRPHAERVRAAPRRPAVGSRERRELDPPGAVREALERVGGDLQRQPRLAAAARRR